MTTFWFYLFATFHRVFAKGVFLFFFNNFLFDSLSIILHIFHTLLFDSLSITFCIFYSIPFPILSHSFTWLYRNDDFITRKFSSTLFLNSLRLSLRIKSQNIIPAEILHTRFIEGFMWPWKDLVGNVGTRGSWEGILFIDSLLVTTAILSRSRFFRVY